MTPGFRVVWNVMNWLFSMPLPPSRDSKRIDSTSVELWNRVVVGEYILTSSPSFLTTSANKRFMALFSIFIRFDKFRWV